MGLEADIDRVRGWVSEARAVVVLTGSGVSAESRIPTFRDKPDPDDHTTAAGLWRDFDPMTLATPEAYARDPAMVSEWYDWRRLKCARAEPNAGHVALAEMQRSVEGRGGSFVLLTQNVDGLHQRAGSAGVVELHGSINAWRGVETGRGFDLPEDAFPEYPPRFSDGEIARPGVVWFGEMLPASALEASERALASCDLFLTAGTSSVVWPAAGFIGAASANGARTVEVNPDETGVSGACDLVLRGNGGVVLPGLV